jgi:hypothetical protein
VKVYVYVEGPSDVAAMRALFANLIAANHNHGIWIEFVQAPTGDRKKKLLLEVPIRARNHILNEPGSHVAVVPDLYPKNRGFDHTTSDELELGMKKRFVDALGERDKNDSRVLERFHVFCFKHDLEVLVLAAHEQLASRLGIAQLNPTWTIPVEDQNHDRHPKKIVRELFEAHGDRYEETVDAPLILAAADYRTIAQRCPQCFAPFVDFLTNLPQQS